MQDIAVAIINYNTEKYTVDWVNSVFEKTGPALNIQIVEARCLQQIKIKFSQ